MGSIASDDSTANATDAVQRATALVRAAAGQLRNPMPARSGDVVSDFLAPLLSQLQQQQPLLDFNPLNAQSLSELAQYSARNANTAAAAPNKKSRPSSLDEMANAVLAAMAKGMNQSVAKRPAASIAQRAARTANEGGRKFTLVKPSLQQVNTQLMDMWEQIEATAPSAELKKLAQDNRKNLQNINDAIAPRAAAGRSGGATLGKLLQQLEVLAADALAVDVYMDLIPENNLGKALDPAAASSPTVRKPKSPQSLAQLADIVGDLWQQTFPSSKTASSKTASTDAAKNAAPAKKQTSGRESSPGVASPAVDAVAVMPAGSVSVAPTAKNPLAAPSVTNPAAGSAGAAPAIDAHVLASGINEVLREQAWLAGVDLT